MNLWESLLWCCCCSYSSHLTRSISHRHENITHRHFPDDWCMWTHSTLFLPWDDFLGVVQTSCVKKRLCSVRNSSPLPGSFVYELNHSLHRVIPRAKRPWFTFQSIMRHLYCVKLKYHKVARNFWAECVYFWPSCARVCATCACEM